MKIILFGSNGMLGNYLKTYLKDKYEILALTRNDLDLAKEEESTILKYLHDNVSKEDVIINASGVIKQRSYELIDMIKVNSLFPHILAKVKKDIGCNVIHITTDCVFSGKRGSYYEYDKHDCLDDYGKSKSIGENPTLTTIRTSIIGEEIMNKKSLLEWVKSNKKSKVDGYENHSWNGVTCLELSKLIEKIISENSYWNGVKHVFSPMAVSKYRLVQMISEIYNLDITVEKITTQENCYRNLLSNKYTLIDKPLHDQLLELKNFKLDDKH